jgi:hypothetical protein
MSRSQKQRAARIWRAARQRQEEAAGASHRREPAHSGAQLFATRRAARSAERGSVREQRPAAGSLEPPSERELHKASRTGWAMTHEVMLQANRSEELDPWAEVAMKVDERVPAFHLEYAATGR